MNGTHVLACLLLSVALGAANGDRAKPPGRVMAGPAAERWASVIPREQFFIAGWVMPPVDSTNVARMDELAGAGLNLMLPAFEDSGRVADNLKRLDLAAARGIRCIIWDRRYERVFGDRSTGVSLLDSIVADYRDHPAMLAHYLGDEPAREGFSRGAAFFDTLHAHDPQHPYFNNLAGRAGFHSHDEWITHHREYIQYLRPGVLCNDHYDFRVGRDRGQFVENAAGLGALAREAGLPFWSFMQLTEHDPFRRVTPGELKWQVSMLLAYGARGIGYFTYWTPRWNPVNDWQPAIIDTNGNRTEWYPVIAQLSRFARSAGSTLARCTWLATVHAGSLPLGGTWFVPNSWVGDVEGRAALGYFSDSSGVRYLLVANSDSLAARAITLTLHDAEQACVLDENHDTWDQVTCAPLEVTPAGSRLTLNLQPGSFALARVDGAVTGVAGGVAPGLSVTPNPAQTEVRLALSRVGYRARLEILDAGGRRAWSRAIEPGATTMTWRGERDAGGAARPGLYFARLEDERGVAVVRLVWLGGK